MLVIVGTEPDYRKMSEYAGKIGFFSIFSRFHHWFFLNFCSKIRIRIGQNIFSTFEKFYLSAEKKTKMCLKSSFFQIFIGLLIVIFLLFGVVVEVVQIYLLKEQNITSFLLLNETASQIWLLRQGVHVQKSGMYG